MTAKPAMLNINEVQKTLTGNGGGFIASTARLGAQLGMTQMGCSLVELEPGKRAWPYHLHYAQEELFVIIEGQGALRYDGQEYAIRQGDVFFAGTGPGTAHQIINSSDATLKYLAFSSMESPEICFYPDSEKYGCYASKDEDKALRFIARADSAVGYFDGE